MAATARLTWDDPRQDGDGILSLQLPRGASAAVAHDLDDTPITIFEDEATGALVSIETDTPEAVEVYANLLRAQPYPPVDVPEADLKGVHPAEALLWGFYNLERSVPAPLQTSTPS